MSCLFKTQHSPTSASEHNKTFLTTDPSSNTNFRQIFAPNALACNSLLGIEVTVVAKCSLCLSSDTALPPSSVGFIRKTCITRLFDASTNANKVAWPSRLVAFGGNLSNLNRETLQTSRSCSRKNVYSSSEISKLQFPCARPIASDTVCLIWLIRQLQSPSVS